MVVISARWALGFKNSSFWGPVIAPKEPFLYNMYTCCSTAHLFLNLFISISRAGRRTPPVPSRPSVRSTVLYYCVVHCIWPGDSQLPASGSICHYTSSGPDGSFIRFLFVIYHTAL